MSDLISIIFRPRQTVDKLLRERSMSRSWQATWTLILAYSIFTLLYLLLGRDKILAPLEDEFGVTSSNFSLLMVFGFWVAAVVFIILDAILSRFGWEWFARMGLRMFGGPQYASLSPEEKRERGQLMQLIQPYTYSVVIVGSILGSLLSLFTMPTPNLNDLEPQWSSLLLQMVGSSFAGLLSLGATALMIVQRVFAIQKVYGVSGARAFWGPFIPYAILIVLVIVLAIVAVIALIAVAFGALENTPGMNTF